MSDAPLMCANHPGRETTLRCNRCNKPICSKCAVQTPVGYRCRECVRGQQAVFETAHSVDYPIAAGVSAIGVAVATGLLTFLGFWGFILAPVVGGGIAEIVRWGVRRRRSRRLPAAAAIGGAMGLVPYLILPLAGAVLSFSGKADLTAIGGTAMMALWPLAYGVLMIGTLYYRLRGIRL
jgi:hypothetical protein